MKILHINTNDTGGAFNAAYRLFSEQKREGLHVKFLCLNNYHNLPDVTYFSRKLTYPFLRKILWKFGIPYTKEHYQIKINSQIRGMVEKYSLVETDHVIQICPEYQEADIIHFHWINEFIDLSRFKANGKQIVWTFHDLNPVLGGTHYESDQKRILKKFHSQESKIKAAKRSFFSTVKPSIITPSCWLKNRVLNEDILPSSIKIQVIPYGIDLKLYHVLENTISIPLDQQKNSSKIKKNILIVAENLLNPRKGFSFINQLIDNFCDKVNFMIVGKNNYNNKSLENFGFVRDQEKLANIYKKSDILILPSLEDNLPNVMLEAFACGIPVISFSNGGMRDHVNTETGILINSFRYGELASAVENFINNRIQFDRNKIRKYAESNFDIRLQGKAYEDLYKQILNF